MRRAAAGQLTAITRSREARCRNRQRETGRLRPISQRVVKEMVGGSRVPRRGGKSNCAINAVASPEALRKIGEAVPAPPTRRLTPLSS